MEEKKTSVFANGLIWFGAAISIAEILTGTLIAPLGFAAGFAAIVIGHVIGCVLLWLAGLIGAKTGKSSMETVKISFGQKGSILFSFLNVLQLVGWTAVMIISGASAASYALDIGGDYIWCLIIGALIILWLLIGLKNLTGVNTAAMGALFILTVFLSIAIFKNTSAVTSSAGTISFGAAVELAVAMPLSWLPLISDYTRCAKKAEKSAAVSSIVYFFASCWMYLIGMGAAILTGETDIAKIVSFAGLGLAALIIIIFSTVTTTFLDVYSAGVSAESLCSRFKERPTAIAVCIIGTLLAIFTPISQFENFLYLIGSVFAPMIAILAADFFILKKDRTKKSVDMTNIIIWAVGFIIYRGFINYSTPVGITLPVMIITALLCIGTDRFKKMAK